MRDAADRTPAPRAIRSLLVRGDDPYAGADMPSVRNAVGVLLLLHAILTLAFLPLAPPTAVTSAGWVVGGGVVALSAAGAAWVLRGGASVTFNRLLALSYLGLTAPIALELLSASSVPYQLLFLVWVGCGGVQPSRRAVGYLMTLALATLTPFLVRPVGAQLADAVAWTVLFTAVGLLLAGYVSYVRTQRLELRTGERHARALASAATQRVRDLQWVTDATIENLPAAELLHEVLRRVSEALGVEHGSVLLFDDKGDELRLAASVGELGEDGRDLPCAGAVLRKIVAERRAVAVEQIEPNGELESRLVDAGLTSLLGVPLPIGESVLGVLYVAARGDRRFLDDDAGFLQLVGDRLALAVERAHLFEGQREIAETLQRSLLPDALPRVPDAVMAVRYRPGGSGVEVGGDWYDVLDLRDGRLALTIGDVVGRGLRAATLMSRLKTALQAYALEGHEPAAVLERLHLLLEGQASDAIATVLVLVLDPSEGTVVFANAGHLPPLLRRPDGRARYLSGPKSPPLGAVPYARYEQRRISIGTAFTLFLFTDGLVERRGANLDSRLEQLRREVEAGPADPEALCDATLATMLGDQELEDDVALLSVQVAPLPQEGFTLDFPAEPGELATVRAVVDRWLAPSGAHDRDVYAIKAATVEACANAIEHAYRPGDAAVRLEARRSDDEVSVTVRDFGRWRGPRGQERGRGIALMKQLMDAAEIDRSEHGTVVRLARRVGEERGL